MPTSRAVFGREPSPRSEFLTRFASQDKRTEPQTSILQALLLMNGKFVDGRDQYRRSEHWPESSTRRSSKTRRTHRGVLPGRLSRKPGRTKDAAGPVSGWRKSSKDSAGRRLLVAAQQQRIHLQPLTARNTMTT